MQNFVGASKLAGNTQNRPKIPKNRTKTLKTEQKQSLEARRSIAGVSPEYRRRQPNSPDSDRRRRKYQEQQPQTQSTTTRQRFNINSAAVQTNQVLRQPLTSPPAATFGTKHHRPGRPNNMTDHQKQTFFFPSGRCSGLHKTRTNKKNC
jgi:hypothetical protein